MNNEKPSSIRVMIVDQDTVWRKNIVRWLRSEPCIERIDEESDGVGALEAIHTILPHAVFLDSQIPEINGFDLLRRLSPDGMQPAVIVTTENESDAIQAFEMQVVDFMLKPFSEERFRLSWERAKRWISMQMPGNTTNFPWMFSLPGPLREDRYISRIPIRINQRIIVVHVDDIESVEAEGGYVRLQAKGSSHLLRENLSNLETRLNPAHFIRIHRSAIVRIDAILELQHWSRHEYLAVLRSGRKLVVSRGYRDRLKSIFYLPLRTGQESLGEFPL